MTRFVLAGSDRNGQSESLTHRRKRSQGGSLPGVAFALQVRGRHSVT